jgi:hypothetical protein
MIRANHLVATSRSRTELKLLLLASGQTLLVLIGLAMLVLAAESLGGF